MTRILLILSLIVVSHSASALESIQFTNRELGAVLTLMRPELNAIELSGQKVVYKPAPSIRYLGVENSETPLDLSVFGDIAGLEFNHLKAKTPELKFSDGSFELKVPVEDRMKAVQSRLGSIHFKDVVLTAQVGWRTRAQGQQELVVLKTIFSGNLKGTGILSSGFILNKTRDLCLAILSKALGRFLSEDKVQNAVNSALIEYAKIYSGIDAKELEPGSIRLSENGIQYEVH